MALTVEQKRAAQMEIAWNKLETYWPLRELPEAKREVERAVDTLIRLRRDIIQKAK